MTVDAVRAGLRAWRRSSWTSSTAPPGAPRRLPAPRPPARRLRARVRCRGGRARRIGSPPMILAIDQGTTGTTCLVFDEQARLRRARLPRVHAALPAARAGWSTTRPRSGRCRARSRDEALDGRRRRAPATSARSASPTSARRSSPGTSAPASRCTARSSGRTAARPRAATSCARRASRSWCASAPGLVIDPYFSGHEDRVAAARTSTGLRERARAGRRALRDDRRLARLQAHRPRGDRLLERVAHDAVRHPRAALGRRAVRRCSACRRRRCPRRSPSAQVLGETDPDAFFGAARAARRHGRRPAGGAVRAGLPSSPGLGKNTYGTGSFVLQNAGRAAAAGRAPGC